MKHKSFSDIIKPLQEKGEKPKLIVGNGFSIAWSADVFRYQAILEQADETNAFAVASEFSRSLFNKLDTNDFESVVKSLSTTQEITSHYNCKDTDTINKIKSDITHIQNILVETISKHHPDNYNAISNDEYEACKLFLNYFGKIYTINYDLLLYWVINKYLDELKFKDKFEDPVAGTLDDGEEYYEEDYVKWSLGNEQDATLFYLHGALHLYDAGYEVRKYSQKRTGISLKNQIINSLNKGLYPIFISGGDSNEKMEKINHSGYLSRCYRSLQGSGGKLFCFGMSFKSNDSHILNAIANSTISDLYVSVFGHIDDPSNAELKLSMERLKLTRESQLKNSKKRTDIKIEYFDSQSANVWGKNERK